MRDRLQSIIDALDDMFDIAPGEMAEGLRSAATWAREALEHAPPEPEEFVATRRALFPISAPAVEAVDVRDIAYSLENLRRWNGHTTLSVAAHSLNVARIALELCEHRYPGHSQMAQDAYDFGLLHDAHEAYCGDVASPIKRLLFGWSAFEERLSAVVHQAFYMPPISVEIDELVRLADLIALHAEADAFFGASVPLPPLPPLPPLVSPRCVSFAPASFESELRSLQQRRRALVRFESELKEVLPNAT